MKLGGSLRRHRGRGGGGDRPGREESSPYGWKSLLGETPGWGRVAAAAAGLAFIGWFGGYLVATHVFFPAPPPPKDLVHVPDVRGEGLTAAREQLEAEGLELGAVDSLRHPSVAKGMILGQSPLPTQLAEPGTQVRVTESLGPQLRTVPDVRRIDVDRARMVLETTGFLVSVDSVDADIPRGRVLESVPPPEDTVALPAEIQLQVSRGPPLVPMPLLLGMDEEDALTVLDSLGLVVGKVEEVFRFGRDQGVVVQQEPPADTPMERGSAVSLSVGKRGG